MSPAGFHRVRLVSFPVDLVALLAPRTGGDGLATFSSRRMRCAGDVIRPKRLVELPPQLCMNYLHLW
jgi:hypothetical protein